MGFGPVVRSIPPGSGAVLPAAELSPAEASSLGDGAVAAVATAAGAPLSHAAILVRSLGIPAVSGAGDPLLDVPAGTTVLVDGDTGRRGAGCRHHGRGVRAARRLLRHRTDDLTQYTLAIDKANAAVAGLADGLHPAVLALVRSVTAAAARHHRTACVVGELGTDPLAVPLLLGLGVTALSVRPDAVAALKQVVRAVDVDEARLVAEAALGDESAAAVRRAPPPTSDEQGDGAPRPDGAEDEQGVEPAEGR